MRPARDFLIIQLSNSRAVTVRDRDTMEQERVKIEDLKAYFEKKFEW